MTAAVIPAGFRLVHFDQLAQSPVEPVALLALSELMVDGYATTQTHYWDDRVIALLDGHNAEVATFIIWRPVKHTRSAFVSLGATVPGYRRRGLYRALFGAFTAHLREKHPNLVAVESGYHVDNRDSAAMHKALGRTPVGVTTRFDLAAR